MSKRKKLLIGLLVLSVLVAGVIAALYKTNTWPFDGSKDDNLIKGKSGSGVEFRYDKDAIPAASE